MYDYGYLTVDPCADGGVATWANVIPSPRPVFTPTVTIRLAEYEDLKRQRDSLLEERDTLLARVNEQAERIALALCTLDPWDDISDEEDDDEDDEGDEV